MAHTIFRAVITALKVGAVISTDSDQLKNVLYSAVKQNVSQVS